MKLISLNTWGGKMFEPLMDFIKENAADTDIFCFQEIFSTASSHKEKSGFRLDLYQQLITILPEFKGYFNPCLENYIAGSFQENMVDFDLSWGLATFVNKQITVKSAGEFFVFGNSRSFNPKDENSVPRNVQYIQFKKDGRDYTICNLHGVWVRGPKIDTPSRIQQSGVIKDFLTKQHGKKIVVGDFNLDINTKSLAILEKDLQNLITEFNIEKTRSRLSPFFGKDDFQKFADYTFVSEDVNVESFEVPDVQISDHLPMILEFE